MTIFTPSSLKTYQSCPRKYYFSYELQIKPREEPIYFKHGHIVHKILELYYTTDRNISDLLGLAIEMYGDMDKNLAAILGQLQAYMHKYPRDEFKTYDNEKLCSFRVAGEFVRGRKDAVVTYEDGKRLLLDYKTTGDSLVSFREKMDYDLQPLIYLLEHSRNNDEILDGVLYRVLKKPTLRLKKSETEAEFYERIIQDYTDRPDEYLDSFIVYKNEDDLSWAMSDIYDWINSIGFSGGHIRPRNLQECHKYSPCPFLPLCQKQEPDQDDINNFYQKKTSQHEELEER